MKYWPLSPLGSAVFLASLLLLGTAVPRGQSYGIFLGTLLILYLVISLLRLLPGVLSFDGERFQWILLWNFGARSGIRRNMALRCPRSAPRGTAYLFSYRADLFNGAERLYTRRGRIPFFGEGESELVMPLPGEVRCTGRLYASDLFGLIGIPLTGKLHRTVSYYPPYLRDRPLPSLTAADRDEETVKNSPTEPEKILMRDYQPGDLIRDINWKASGKFTSLYTRIAPDQERSVNRIVLIIRPEGTSEIGEPAGQALLLGLKSLCFTLIQTLRRDFPENTFQIIGPGGDFFLAGEEGLSECLPWLSSLGKTAAAPPGESSPPGALLCTTRADRSIPRLREIYGERLFICGCAAGSGEGDNPRYSLFMGNALPRGESLRSALSPRSLEKKTLRALRDRPEYACPVITEVCL